jgi:repressor LexA
MELTSKQKEVLIAIKVLYGKKGISPTYEEVRDYLGYKTISSLQAHVKALKKKGYLLLDKKIRGLVLSGTTKDQIRKMFNIAYVGEVACGSPNLAVEDIHGYIPYLADKLSGKADEYIFLEAKGDSMDDAGIIEGDLLLIKRQNSIPNIGEKVVVLIGDEATVKFLRFKDGVYYLEPKSKNKDHKPIYLTNYGNGDITFCGVVKDIIKKKK